MLLNFNHLKEANSNDKHHFSSIQVYAHYMQGAVFLLGIVHTIFPFIVIGMLLN